MWGGGREKNEALGVGVGFYRHVRTHKFTIKEHSKTLLKLNFWGIFARFELQNLKLKNSVLPREDIKDLLQTHLIIYCL